MPSGLMMIPDPCPRRPELICTVERRRRSATSPKPSMGISIPPSWPLSHGQRRFLQRTAANHLHFHGLADQPGAGVGLEVFDLFGSNVAQRDHDITDQKAALISWRAGFDGENHQAARIRNRELLLQLTRER